MMMPWLSPTKNYCKYSTTFPSTPSQPGSHLTHMDSPLPPTPSVIMDCLLDLTQLWTQTTTGNTTYSTQKMTGYVTCAPLCRPKLLGFLQLSQMVKGPHLNLAQFDLDWGHQVPWRKVVEEWKQEQLEQASWRTKEKRQRQLEQQWEHIWATWDWQQRMKTWNSSTPSTSTSCTATSTNQASPPHTLSTLTAPQCIE